MKYDFDAYLDRKNTQSIKWDFIEKNTGIEVSEDIIPMWIADMDFKAPQEVIDAIKDRADHGAFGYADTPDSTYQAIIDWMDMQFAWKVKKEWIRFSPGVVPGIVTAINAYTHPGDEIIIQPPVYYPFFMAIKNNGRIVVENDLILSDNTYIMDATHFQKLITPRTKAFILCSPHNPVGRVWTKAELETITQICIDNDILVISDEIHSDLAYSGYKHIPTASLSKDFAQNTITFMAPSKTFNVAGLISSVVIIPNNRLRNEFDIMTANQGMSHTKNLLGIIAMETAYRQGKDWLEQVLAYMEDNIKFMIDFIEKRLPGIKVIKPEATYIVWLDCRELGIDNLFEFIINKANVLLNEGSLFGVCGRGFQRINIACPRSTLEKALLRIEKAINSNMT
jgi:cysteine-S-conjugate beta-lyase